MLTLKQNNCLVVELSGHNIVRGGMIQEHNGRVMKYISSHKFNLLFALNSMDLQS